VFNYIKKKNRKKCQYKIVVKYIKSIIYQIMPVFVEVTKQ